MLMHIQNTLNVNMLIHFFYWSYCHKAEFS